MGLRIVATDRAPRAIGPYSQAIVGAGTVYCSGQIGLDPATGRLASGGPAAETRQALRNLEQVLVAAGAGLEQVVKTTLYVTNLDDFDEINAAYAEVFGPCWPARATVEVARLPRDAKVEIDAVALLR